MRNHQWFLLLVGFAMLLCSCDFHRVMPCGDGVIQGEEQCDDGNWTPGDGCDAQCQLEQGWSCTPVLTVCTSICGDGLQVGDETCDDGNLVSGDDCSDTCQAESCGDGVLQPERQEVCDDGNQVSGDGCRADCLSDETCGNGVVDVQQGEICDDGNDEDGDGCETECLHTPTIVSPGGPIRYFAVDHAHLYWSDGQVLQRWPLAGGTVSVVASDIGRFILDDAYVYGIQTTGYLANDATFLSVPKEGGTPTVLLTTASRIADFAVNATHLFWADADATTLSRVDLAGGLAEIVVSDTTPPHEIAVDDTHVYWLGGDSGDGCLSRSSVDGGPTTLLASGMNWPRALTLEPDYAYWADEGALFSLDKSGGSPLHFASADFSVALIAVDAMDLYLYGYGLQSGDNHWVSAVPKTGGWAVSLANACSFQMTGLALSSTQVYFGCARGPGAVLYSIPKYPH